MSWGAIIAVYFLFWVSAAFLMLPFGVRTDEEMGSEKVAGQADSAPHRFDIPKHIRKATILGTLLFAIYYANWYFGWVTADNLDFYH